jgi:hypothetical protein
MMALNHKQSRIVRGYSAKARYFHSWVEVKYFGRWYYVDPVWVLGSGITTVKADQAENNPEVFFVCPHEVFFGLKGVSLLVDRLKSSTTSFYLSEIREVFTATSKGEISGFCGIYWLEEMLANNDGRRFIEFEMERPITQEVFESTFPKTPA